VRAQCLALDYAHVDGHVQHLWGIYGGLGARDRRELLPLWMELSTRLAGSARVGGVEPNWDTTVPEVAPSRPVAS
jgi:hypothetical protein